MMRSSLAEMTPDGFGSSRDLSRNGSEMTVFERQQTQMKFLQQQHQSSAGETQYNDQARKIQASQQTQSLMKGDLGLLNPCLGWPEFGHLSMPKEMLHSSSDNVHDRYSLEMSTLTTAFSTGVPYRTATLENEGDDIVVAPKSSLEIVKDSLKKRKADQLPNPKSIHMKGGTSINKQVVPDASKENSKTSEVTKPEYIHVRARRGQATDSHSLAERVRREKISQRMRILQDLVPGCNKITGKAGMLDEIINYVQALQRQVEFLSMKLATFTTAHDFNNIINVPAEVYTGVAVADAISHAHLFFNQSHASNITEIGQNSFDTARGSTMSTPTSVHKYFLDAAGFTPPLTWNPDFQAVPGQTFHQSRSATFSSHPTEGDTTSMSYQFTMF